MSNKLTAKAPVKNRPRSAASAKEKQDGKLIAIKYITIHWI